MENVDECLQCVQLGKRWKDEKIKHDKKKNLIALFKELLYAHDLKLCNFTRTNLRDVYSKYLIDGEQVRQRLAGTLATLNELTEAYSSTIANSEAQQKKILDLEGKLTHLEFLNKQLSDYYNQVESDNKKPRAEGKVPKAKKEKDAKKTGKKQNVKVEIKSDPSSPESNITFDNAVFNFTSENSVKNEPTEDREVCVEKSTASTNSLEIDSDDLATTLEEELLKAKDILESDSDFESNHETFNFSDEGEQLPELSESILFDSDNLISQLENPSIEEVTCYDEQVISNNNSENINLHETESDRNFPDDSGISSYNSSPVNEDEDRNSLCLQEEITDLRENYSKNNSKSVVTLENMNQIIESNTKVISPIKLLKKSKDLKTCTKKSDNNSSARLMNGYDPKKPKILIKPSQNTDENLLSNDNKNLCSDMNGSVEYSVDCGINKEIDASESNLNQHEKEIENREMTNKREKVYILKQYNVSKPKLMPKGKLLSATNKWSLSDPNLTWVEKSKVNHNENDCTEICKALMGINLNGKSIVKKKSCSKLKPNLFKTLTSKGLFQCSTFTVTPKKWFNSRIFGNLSDDVHNSDNEFTHETSFNFSSRNEQVFSTQNMMKNDNCDLNFMKANSFYEYRIKTEEEEVKFQQISGHNNAPSVTISFNLLNKDTNNHPRVEEVFKFTFTHPLVRISGLEDRQIMINSMNDLIQRVRKFSDEMEILNEKYFCTPSSAGDAAYMSNCRESIFNCNLPYHQTTNGQNYNFNRLTNYQMGGNLNSLLMKSSYSPCQASTSWNENASEHLTNEKFSSANIFNVPSLSSENNQQTNIPLHRNINVNTACTNSHHHNTSGTSNYSNTSWSDIPFPSQSNSQFVWGINSSRSSAGKMSNSFGQTSVKKINSPGDMVTDILPARRNFTQENGCREVENAEIISNPEYSNSDLSSVDNSLSKNIDCLHKTGKPASKMNAEPLLEARSKNILMSTINDNIFYDNEFKAPLDADTSGMRSPRNKMESRSRTKAQQIVCDSNLNSSRQFPCYRNNQVNSQINADNTQADITCNPSRQNSNLSEKTPEVDCSVNITSCYKEFSRIEPSLQNIRSPLKLNKTHLNENKDGKKTEETYISPKSINKKCTLNKNTSQKITSAVCKSLLEAQLTSKDKKVVTNQRITPDSVSHNDSNKVTSLINQESKFTTSASPKIHETNVNLMNCSSGKKDILKNESTSFTVENNLQLTSDKDYLRTSSSSSENLIANHNHLNKNNDKHRVDVTSPTNGKKNILKNYISKQLAYDSVVNENSNFKEVKHVITENEAESKNENFPYEDSKQKKTERKKKNIVKKVGKNASSEIKSLEENTKNVTITCNLTRKSSRKVNYESEEKKFSSIGNNSVTFDITSKKVEFEEKSDETFLEINSVAVILEEYKSIRPLSPLPETVKDFKQKQTIENNVLKRKLNQENDLIGNLEVSNFDDKNLLNRKDYSKATLSFETVESSNITTKASDVKELKKGKLDNKRKKCEEETTSNLNCTKGIDSAQEEDVSKNMLELKKHVDSDFSLSDTAIINRNENCNDSDKQVTSAHIVETLEVNSKCSSENNLLSDISNEMDSCNNTTNSSVIKQNGKLTATLNQFSQENNEEISNEELSRDSDKIKSFTIKSNEIVNDQPREAYNKNLKEEFLSVKETMSNRGNKEIENSSEYVLMNKSAETQENNLKITIISDESSLDVCSAKENHSVNELEKIDNCISGFYLNRSAKTEVGKNVEVNGIQEAVSEENNLNLDSVSNENYFIKSIKRMKESSVTENCKTVHANQNGLDFYHDRSDKSAEKNSKSEICGMDLINSEKENISLSNFSIETDNKSNEGVNENDKIESNQYLFGFYCGRFDKTNEENGKGEVNVMEETFVEEDYLNFSNISCNKSNEEINENDKINQYLLGFYRDRPDKTDEENDKAEVIEMEEKYDEEGHLSFSNFSDVSCNKSNEGINENDKVESNQYWLGFYRDRSDITEEENNNAEVAKMTEIENKASKRKISFTGSLVRKKIPRLLAEDEILECKNESAMRTSLRYFAMKLKEQLNCPSQEKERMKQTSIYEDRKIKSLIDSYVDTSSEKRDKFIAIIDKLSTMNIKVIARFILEHLVADKEEIVTLTHIPQLTKIQKRLLMLIVSLAHSKNIVYNFVLNSFEEALASFRDKTIDLSYGIRVAFFYTALCRSQGFLSRARSLLFDILYTRGLKGIIIVLKMIATWPFLMPHASFAKNCLITKVLLHILLSSTNILSNKYAKKEFCIYKKNVTMKYGYDNLEECLSSKEELFNQILSRITEKGSGLALLLLTKFYNQPWSSKMVESCLLPYLRNWLDSSERGENDESADLIATEIALSIGRISRGFPKLKCRALINTIIITFENMLNKTEDVIVIEAVIEALVLMRRHNLQMCTAVIGKWHPKGQFITKKVAELIRLIVAVKPLSHWMRFLDQVDPLNCF